MADAAARGWGNPGKPGSATGATFRRNYIVPIDAGGRRLYVHRQVAHLFKGFIDEIVARGYRIDQGDVDDWGYAHRLIRGSKTTLSNHSWGLAVDLNATTNPMLASRLVTDMPAWVVECAEKWGLHWGGNYKSRPDPMHFEFLGRPEDVALYPLPAHEPTVAAKGDDLLMAAAKDDNDARKALILDWYVNDLGRVPNDDEVALHLWVFARDGAFACRKGIAASPEATKRRAG
jgi:hypothetical protein